MDPEDPVEEVLAANRRYYDAFEAGDLDGMSDLWRHSPEVSCTHPGWATLRGWGQVGASYYALFQGGRQPQFVITREHPVVVGDVGWVSLDENLLGEQGGVTVATINLFVRAGAGRWLLVCHHGSVVQATLE